MLFNRLIKTSYICLILSLTNNTFGEDTPPQGCLVKSQKKILLDPSCKCLEKKLCATPAKIEYNEKNFSRKESNGKSTYSEQEKKMHKESYEVYNKIMALKSQGKGDSPEIKEYYFKLASLDSAILASYKKNHPLAHNLIQNAQKKAQVKTSQKLKNIQKAIRENKESPTKENPKLASIDKNINIEQKESPLPTEKANNTSAPKEAQVTLSKNDNQLSNEDKKNILQNLKSSEYNVKEEDSLFDIISKKYKDKAYKVLLEVKEEE